MMNRSVAGENISICQKVADLNIGIICFDSGYMNIVEFLPNVIWWIGIDITGPVMVFAKDSCIVEDRDMGIFIYFFGFIIWMKWCLVFSLVWSRVLAKYSGVHIIFILFLAYSV